MLNSTEQNISITHKTKTLQSKDCFSVACVLLRFAIILMVKRELDALHELPSLCLVTVSVLWPFPHGAVDVSAVFDCDTSQSYSLSFSQYVKLNSADYEFQK